MKNFGVAGGLVAAVIAFGVGVNARGELPRHLDLVVASRAYGTLFAVDPTTGLIRSVITGPDLRDAAKPVRGAGTLLAGASSGDIGTSRDGRIFWKLAPGANAWASYQIDAATGNRIALFGSAGTSHDSSGTPVMLNAKTLLLAADGFVAAAGGNSRVLGYALPAGPTTILSGDLIGDGPRMFRGRMAALADNRTVYVAEVGNLGGIAAGCAIYRVSLATGAREFISRLSVNAIARKTVTAGVLSAGTTNFSRGTGPVTNGQVRSLLLRGGKLYAGISSQKPDLSFVSGILSIDVATGNRTLVVGSALADDGVGATVVSAAPSNAGALGFDSPSGLTEMFDHTIVFSSLFNYDTLLRLNPETREVTMVADLGPQVTADVRTKMLLTSVAIFVNCPGDLNLDGVVDDADFTVFVQAYDTLDCADAATPAPCPADLNGDLLVDDTDFSKFVVGYDGLLCE